MYAEPPYGEGPRDVAEFAEHFRAHVRRSGFRLVPARDGDDGRRTFAVIELAVRQAWRRRRIAAALHARLLDGLDVERVTLTVRPEPEAGPARAAYAAWGYRKAGVSRPWDGAPLYDCMLRERSP